MEVPGTLGDRRAWIDVLASSWRDERKYGERSPSCASSRSSIDSRFSEDFSYNEKAHRNRSRSFGGGGNWDYPSVGAVLGQQPPATKQHTSGGFIWRKLQSYRKTYVEIRASRKKNRSRLAQAEVHLDPLGKSSSCGSLSIKTEDVRSAGVWRYTTEPKSAEQQLLHKRILTRVKGAVIKWQSKENFIAITSNLGSKSPAAHYWRKRRAAANQLLRLALESADSSAIVARRFLKTEERQLIGLRAILQLREEEDLYGTGGYQTDAKNTLHSVYLLGLVFFHVDQATFCQKIVPSILQDWPVDRAAVILWLARSIPDFFTRTELVVFAGYGRRVVQQSVAASNQWLKGMELLVLVLLSCSALGDDSKIRHPTAKFILHAGMEAIVKQSSTSLNGCHREGLATVETLGAVITACLETANRDVLEFILPSSITLEPFVATCIDMVIVDGIDSWLALKALVLLRDVTNVAEGVPAEKASALGQRCMSLVFTQGPENALNPQVPAQSPYLRPEEDAFDILCSLGQPIFANALAIALRDRATSPSSPQYTDNLFKALEPLLWLSNMPSGIQQVHHALVEGGACEFLANVILNSLPNTWMWEHRAAWRVKGEAITCLGNIIERMDELALRSRIKTEIVEAMVAIYNNVEYPLAERQHAEFTLKRYREAVDRYGIATCASLERFEMPTGGSI